MKTIKQTIAWSVLILVVASGCRKYNEGPGLSLRSKTARVSNEWKVESAYDYKDSVTVTQDYMGETWEFTKDGEFMERDNGTIEKNGTWNFTPEKDSLQVKVITDIDSYYILRLKENEIWLRDKDEELHLVPVN